MRQIQLVLVITLFLGLWSVNAIAAQDSVGETSANPTIKVHEYIVTADVANLRTGAGTNFEVVDSVNKGTSLLIYDEEPEVAGWLRIYQDSGDDAYIAEFLAERAPQRFYPPNQEPILTASGTGTNITDVFDCIVNLLS